MVTPNSVELTPVTGAATAPRRASAISSARRGLTMMYLAVLLWGTVAPVMQLITTLGPTDGRSVGFLRLALALPALLIVGRIITGQLRFAVSPGDLALMVGFGLLTALYQYCFFEAIASIGATAATLISVCLPPLLVTLAATWLRGERPTALVLAALVAALAGAALTALDNAADGLGPAVIIGGLLSVGAALATAGGTLIVRSLVERNHPLHVATVAFAVAALTLLLTALPGGLVLSYVPTGWLLLLYLALIPTALGYVLFFGGMASTTASVASITLVLEPLTAALLVWALFGDRPGPAGLLGALLLLGAAVALTRGSAD